MITKIGNTIHLRGRDVSYIMVIGEHGDLLHYYYGRKLADREYTVPMKQNAWCPFVPEGYTLNNCPQEYPSYGYADLRNPAYSFETETCRGGIAQLKFKGIQTENDAADIPDMPSLRRCGKSVQTAHITLEDIVAGLRVVLSYTVFDEYNIIARSVKIQNIGGCVMRLNRAYSACLELPNGERDAVYFPGAHSMERQREITPIKRGTRLDIANATGGSGHNMNPFVIVADGGADERSGEAYSLSLVYSGNHSTVIDRAFDGTTRVMQGLNPQTFAWELNAGESFFTPQSVLCFSDAGFGGVSRELSDVYRNNLCRSEWTHRKRPVLINNWEATYFDFDEEKLVEIAAKAKEAGIELFVMDDGWFGRRNTDTDGLGDWYVNTEKLPSGLNGLAERVNKLGLKFGLWIEPEMVNPASDLYKNHPEWVIQTQGKQSTLSRNQLVLDLSRKDVCDYIIDTVGGILDGANIEYVKWDMNRPMTDMPCLGYNHRYILGLYRVADTLTERFPEILFEGCAGGGGRFDAGMLYYFPQIWTSDNSDAIARLKIQYATSMGYPVSAIGAHVTAVPNHQNGRVTPLDTRANVAFAGTFGYELDITALTDEEFEAVKRQTAAAKEIRRLVLEGDFYRLQDPYTGNYCAWELVSKDGSEVFAMSCKILSESNAGDFPVKLCALPRDAVYTDTQTGRTYYADELMYRGWLPKYSIRDFDSQILWLKRK